VWQTLTVLTGWSMFNSQCSSEEELNIDHSPVRFLKRPMRTSYAVFRGSF
jgi:hypothetical protein